MVHFYLKYALLLRYVALLSNIKTKKEMDLSMDFARDKLKCGHVCI